MSSVIDCSGPDALAEGTRFAAAALRRGEIVVLPTDTVYGVAADAFSAPAVQLLLEAKGRGRDVPPPVLVPEPQVPLQARHRLGRAGGRPADRRHRGTGLGAAAGRAAALP